MNTFRVYFSDGNQKIYDASDIMEVINYITCKKQYDASQITKIEQIFYSMSSKVKPPRGR